MLLYLLGFGIIPVKHLYRSETNKKLAGVCGGIGEYLDADPTIVRLITVVVTLVTGFLPLIVGYLIAWWLVPLGKSDPASSRQG